MGLGKSLEIIIFIYFLFMNYSNLMWLMVPNGLVEMWEYQFNFWVREFNLIFKNDVNQIKGIKIYKDITDGSKKIIVLNQSTCTSVLTYIKNNFEEEIIFQSGIVIYYLIKLMIIIIC
jgi:hypothetical protein